MNDPSLLLLNGFDGETYLRALIAVVKLHGIEPVERDYVEARAALLKLDCAKLWDEEFDAFPPIPDEVSVVTRRVVVRDCILMGCLDGEYSDEERAWVHKIADWLGLSVETCDRLEDWLHRYFDLLDEHEALLSGFDPPHWDPTKVR